MKASNRAPAGRGTAETETSDEEFKKYKNTAPGWADDSDIREIIAKYKGDPRSINLAIDALWEDQKRGAESWEISEKKRNKKKEVLIHK
jgi:hypothetical protein